MNLNRPVVLRRSYVAGSVPKKEDLSLGEIVINVPDGLLYLRQFDPDAKTDCLLRVRGEIVE